MKSTTKSTITSKGRSEALSIQPGPCYFSWTVPVSRWSKHACGKLFDHSSDSCWLCACLLQTSFSSQTGTLNMTKKGGKMEFKGTIQFFGQMEFEVSQGHVPLFPWVLSGWSAFASLGPLCTST